MKERKEITYYTCDECLESFLVNKKTRIIKSSKGKTQIIDKIRCPYCGSAKYSTKKLISYR